jgi:predicted component of type VI protein secretion system
VPPTTTGPNQELVAVRFVMLGTQGEVVAERVIAPGSAFDVCRAPAEPWNDDEFIEPQHARLTPMRGGVKVEELTPEGGVFRRLSERTPLRDGDQLRIGQSLLVYERAADEPGSGRWGRVIAHPHPDNIAAAIPLGESGVMIGRDIGGITLPNDTFVSGSHCRVVCNDGGVFVEDLDSSNGTYLRLQSGQWVPFDEYLLIGQTQFAIRK